MSQTMTNPTRKITISLPSDLVHFADLQVQQNNSSRSQFISNLLAQFKAQEEERLAIEGYQFYAAEAAEFATATAKATAESLDYAQ